MGTHDPKRDLGAGTPQGFPGNSSSKVCSSEQRWAGRRELFAFDRNAMIPVLAGRQRDLGLIHEIFILCS